MPACEKDSFKLSYSVQNKSGVEIKVSPTQWRTYDLLIKPDEYIERTMYNGKGNLSFNGKGYGFDTDGKPIIVTFDNIYSVTHYNDSLPHTGKYLNKSSRRCIYNSESYAIKTSSKSSFVSETAQYIFTEEDYNFAKQ